MKKLIENAKNLIFVVTGGIGRNIFSTAVIRNLKKAYPDKNIIVVAGCGDMFVNNPNIKRIYQFDKPVYLFEDFIFDNKDSIVLDFEPYRHPDYIANNRHIVECWCDLLEIPCDDIKGDLYFSDAELEMAKLYVEKQGKPFVLLQHVGGMNPPSNDKDQQLISKTTMYRRSLPEKVVQEVVDTLIKDGFKVGSVQLPNQFCPDKVEKVNFPLRSILALIPHVAGIIGIDSFLMHGCASFNKQALILWGGTSTDKLGYKLHKNLRRKECSTPECHRPNSYLFDIQNSGLLWNCPHNDKCMKYDAATIIDAFKEMLGDRYAPSLEKNGKLLEEISTKKCLC
jgi:hypothetical protein